MTDDPWLTPTLFLAVSDPLLRTALERALQRGTPYRVVVGSPSASSVVPAIVLASAVDLSPAECLGLYSAGFSPVVLAPIPSDWQQRSYHQAHAIYLAMNPDAAELIQALAALIPLEELLPLPTEPTMQARDSGTVTTPASASNT